MRRGAWQECPGCGHYLVLVDRHGNKVGLCPECDGSWSRPMTKEEIARAEGIQQGEIDEWKSDQT